MKVWPSLLNDVTQLLNNARDRHLIDGKLREDSTATQEINSHLLHENKCTLKVVAYNAEGADAIQCCYVGQKVFPLLDNESTHGKGFRKSTREVLVGSWSSYTKLTEKSAPEKATIDLTKGDSDQN